MRTVQIKRTTPVTEIKDLFGAETKVLDKDDGIVEAIVSVTGLKDEVDDVIEPRCYGKTLSIREPQGIRSHDWDRFAAKTLKVAELLPGSHELPERTNRGEPWPSEAGAVKVLMQYNLETKDGSEGFSNVKFLGPRQEWSIGYNVPRGGAHMVKGVRHITDIELFEYSDVLFGAMPLAGTQNVKSHGGLLIGNNHGDRLWTPGFKALPGSYQERDSMLEDALNEAFRAESPEDENGMSSGYQMIRGTWADRVVVCFNHRDERQDWEYDYTVDGDTVVLGDRRPVKVEEVLVPDDTPPEDTEAGATEAKLTVDDLTEMVALREYVG